MKNMNRKIMLAAIPIALLVLWFIASWYATNKAEHTLRELMQKYHLEKHVQWEKLRASPFGTVTLSSVKLHFMNDAFFVKKVEISDYESNDKKLSLRLAALQVQDEQGVAPAELFGSFIAATGRASIAPFDFKLEIDTNFNKDSSTLSFALDLPEVADFSGNVQLINVGGLKALTQSQEVASQPERKGMFGIPSQGLALVSLAEIVPTAATIKIQDKGAVERTTTLMKRYFLVPDTTVSNLDKQQAEIFKQELDQLHQQCMIDATSIIQKPKSSCKNLVDFLGKPGKKLELIVTPTEKTSIATLFQSVFMFGFGGKTNIPMIEIK